jgi:raffinose/stachyose/melibiose transport system permease protein
MKRLRLTARKTAPVFSITIPMIKETIIINFVLIITGVFKIYELVYQLTNGGPAHQSEVLVSYMYYTVFTSRRYGYGMAIATVVLLLSVVGSFMYIRLSSRKQRRERTGN